MQHLELSIEAAILAGIEILKIYKTDFSIETKTDNSPLTLADKMSHQKITEFLKQTAYPILSEEGIEIKYNERKNWTTFWLIDPLDGTKEFIKRNGEFTVNIALIENQIPIMGIIYVPVSKELYFASKEEGAFKIENIHSFEDYKANISNREKLPIQKNLNRNFSIVASRSHLSKETENFINSVKKEHGEISIVSKGSSLKLCMIAEGKADVYPRYAPTMEWDTAAGHAIIKYAGGSVKQYASQNEVIYNKEDLLNPWFLCKL